jgi:dimethylhistidine N-methyltransferase
MDFTSALARAAQANREFRADVLEGLEQSPKRLPCKYFYDERGSALFDQICQLDEYYLTRAELAIMDEFAPEMGRQIGPGVMLVEYGSGSSVKTRYLLDGLSDAVAYVPVDVSYEHLHHTAAELQRDYPRIEVLPVWADFTENFALPVAARSWTHAAVYFPGSTIGNFVPTRAAELLGQIAELCGTGGGLLVGIDLKKDVARIHAAYNDRRGVTARFNRNLLARINRELDGDFDLAEFAHRATYNELLGRVEIELVSRRDQVATVDGEAFEFAAGESILTEYSHKYSVEEFSGLAAAAGLTLRRQWNDRRGDFAVLHFAIVE